jgi:hypothetical protein
MRGEKGARLRTREKSLSQRTGPGTGCPLGVVAVGVRVFVERGLGVRVVRVGGEGLRPGLPGYYRLGVRQMAGGATPGAAASGPGVALRRVLALLSLRPVRRRSGRAVVGAVRLPRAMLLTLGGFTFLVLGGERDPHHRRGGQELEQLAAVPQLVWGKAPRRRCRFRAGRWVATSPRAVRQGAPWSARPAPGLSAGRAVLSRDGPANRRAGSPRTWARCRRSCRCSC